ncbi:type II toxin-antitoxin system RelE/ParE family toxin [Kaistella carnis]|uniref:Type II toxin-antitoxin system RelE/ParE family toxin n=1 Tax=Kaistella carnis TaxID=1241979 RepID=A0A3G8XNG1_9FLAO|nr:type II toxin-antitoxin system RelE/ParE family toxin [Kaistella carnis]AZI34083.1 type II toxin-antitoxin system RelE/ParE family toxin [Kaistella carnis]
MKVLLSDRAKFQLKESVHFYEKRKTGLGEKLTNSVTSKLKFVASNPLSSEIKYDEVHVTYLKHFPFAIHYLYINEQSVIFVSAIFHTSQNPNKLR